MHYVAPYSLISSGNLSLHLHADHLADLRASGLNDETIKAAGVYSISPRDIAHFFNGRGVPEEIETAVCFPYQGGDFARIKLFPPGPYASCPAFKKIKYKQRKDTPVRLYVPFSVKPGDIVVIEGEKKTLAAHQAGFNAVGIGGIWNWTEKNSDDPIADLNLIEWTGRDATIIPDSDVFPRPDLLRAIYALGRELRSLGANVLVAQIPQAGAVKVGLDDFLVAGGDMGGLEVLSLSHRVFKSCEYWHGRWKFQKAMQEAA